MRSSFLLHIAGMMGCRPERQANSESNIRSPLVVLVGPTAAGKSSLALALAESVGGEIIAADSMQVYRSLDIGTAKPTADERRRVPHHLLDLVDPDQPFTAADYAAHALSTIAEIRRRGRLPIMVGGTGLYVRAVLRGLFEGPGEAPCVREALRREAASEGPKVLHRRLAALDPEAAAAIHPNDLFRIIRALEVWVIKGQPISFLRAEGRGNRHRVPGPVLLFGLARARQELYSRIEARVEEMLRLGFVDEVRAVLDRGFAPELKPLRAIGYRHIISYLKGQVTLGRAVASLKCDTRRYAKRQLTWFRHEKDIIWLGTEGSIVHEAVLPLLLARIEVTRATTI